LDKAFTERTVELPETSEEVAFQAAFRVREYVVIRKVAQERTRSISTTMRRTEAEIDRLR
jgi:stress response protein YsnF